ncbi:hypothetical protein TWF730_003715 [Orbilia blumenaviensis]|uniref:Uncharacterized protein n=1 Tax=Orbilia blumenaviensis TaxID=1796055 RepID=A0AAV9U3V1_9PEZI
MSQPEEQPEEKTQPWKENTSEAEVEMICPGPPANFKEGDPIIMGRPWRHTEGTLYDTQSEAKAQPWKEGAAAGEVEMICPGPPANFKEGDPIIMGRPWRHTEGTLYDTSGQSSSEAEAKTQPWKEGAAEGEVEMICPGPPANFKEGDPIIMGRPWRHTEGTLYDTAENPAKGSGNA